MSNMKHDAGKPPVWRGVLNYFPRALLEVAKVSQMGYDKYGAWGGWLKVPEAGDRYEDAKARHLLYRAMGQLTDDESDLFHQAHEAWNALATLELMLMEKENGETVSKLS